MSVERNAGGSARKSARPLRCGKSTPVGKKSKRDKDLGDAPHLVSPRSVGVSAASGARVTRSSIVPPGRRPFPTLSEPAKNTPWPAQLRPVAKPVPRRYSLTDSQGRYVGVSPEVKRSLALRCIEDAMRLVRRGELLSVALQDAAGGDYLLAHWARALVMEVAPDLSIYALEQRAEKREVLDILRRALGKAPRKHGGGWRVTGGAK